MKKYIITILCLFIYSLSVNAQQNIDVKIEKLVKGEEIYLKMILTNNNPHGIAIMNFVDINLDGNYAPTLPSTYMTLIGSPVVVANYESLATVNLKQHYSLKHGLSYTDRYGNKVSNAQLTTQVKSLIDSVARVSYSSNGSQNYISSSGSQSRVAAPSASLSQSTSSSVSSQLIYKIESNPIIFSGTLEKGRIRARKAEYVEAGETFTNEVKVFGTDLPNPHYGFERSEVEYIKSIQLKLKMNYFYKGDEERHSEHFYSNVINL